MEEGTWSRSLIFPTPVWKVHPWSLTKYDWIWLNKHTYSVGSWHGNFAGLAAKRPGSNYRRDPQAVGPLVTPGEGGSDLRDSCFSVCRTVFVVTVPYFCRLISAWIRLALIALFKWAVGPAGMVRVGILDGTGVGPGGKRGRGQLSGGRSFRCSSNEFLFLAWGQMHRGRDLWKVQGLRWSTSVFLLPKREISILQ